MSFTGRKEKFIQARFPEVFKRLASTSKEVVREHISLRNAFPPNKSKFVAEALKVAAEALQQRTLLASLKQDATKGERANESDLQLLEGLMEYVSVRPPF